MNGFTYFTNPLSCAIGNAVLQEIRDCDLIANAAKRGPEFKKALEDLKTHSNYVGDVRGKGLLLALELVANKHTKSSFKCQLNVATLFQNLALKNGLMIYGRRTNYGDFGDWLMMTPPLIITKEQVFEISNALAKTLQDFERYVNAN